MIRPAAMLRFPRDGFVGATLVLVTGTAAAQLLSAALMPVISRIYLPADVGLLAVYSAVLTTVGVSAALRFDVAIAIPVQESDARGLLLLSLWSAAAVSAAVLVAVMIASPQLAGLIRQPRLQPHLWLLPIGVLAIAAQSALQSWQIRVRGFRLLARARVAQAVMMGIVQIGLGIRGIGATGLVLGYVIGFAFGAIALAWQPIVDWPRNDTSLTRPALWLLAKRYSRFPKFSTWEALANSAALQVPIIMIATLARPAEAGYMLFASYLVQAPMGLLGTAVSQVYLSHAPEEHANGTLGEFSLKIIGNLMKAGLGPLLAIGVISPAVFGIIFGPGWARAGVLVAWMVPWFVLQFLVSPISMSLHVTGRQRTAMSLQLYGLLVRVVAVWGASRAWSTGLSETYAISGAVFYATYLGVVLRGLDVHVSRLGRPFLRALPSASMWLASALVIAMVVRHLGW